MEEIDMDATAAERSDLLPSALFDDGTLDSEFPAGQQDKEEERVQESNTVQVVQYFNIGDDSSEDLSVASGIRNFNLADETDSLMEREPDEYLEYDTASVT
jgi:hypothetical protein